MNGRLQNIFLSTLFLSGRLMETRGFSCFAKFFFRNNCAFFHFGDTIISVLRCTLYPTHLDFSLCFKD
ncbi:MAG TPA: hypothetical protein DEQ75_08395 [Alphaproteobacteria bacterium]|nr:hypothetical protein [SAR116 cluster bacterium]OUW35970.1 MAG: hypothetical protein CBD43_06345 [Gammaproteobacteria bacterium TMED183]HCD50385.1 hypothetical protein [Alphaproteobacteria bacterium]HCV62925.1 hypothetical protein [Alphaproteobacteria bacterium]